MTATTEGKTKLLPDLAIALLFFFHAFVAYYSYYTPRLLVILCIVIFPVVYKFFLNFPRRRFFVEMLFISCLLNIPFGIGGYLYRPWTMAAAVLACVVPPLVASFMQTSRWAAFRMAFIVIITVGFFASAAMRADSGFDRCPDRRPEGVAASMPSLSNPYGVYLMPGDCSLVACYSMHHKVGAVGCNSKKPAYHETGGNPQRAAFDTSRNRAYFPIRGTNSFAVADISPFRVTKTVHVENASSLLNADVLLPDGSIVMVDERVHSLFIFDPDTFEQTARVPLGWGAAYSVAVDSNRRTAYVSDWAGTYLHMIDLGSLKSRKVYIGPAAFTLKVDESADLVYVTRPLRGAVAVFDADTLEHMRTLKAGYGARDIALDPTRNRIVVGNYFEGTVDVIDLETGKRDKRYKVGPLVRGVTVNPDTGDIYTAWTCGVSKLK